MNRPWWLSLLLWLMDRARLKLDPQYQRDIENFENHIAAQEANITQKRSRIEENDRTLAQLAEAENVQKERQAELEKRLEDNHRQIAELDARPRPEPVPDSVLLRERL